MPDLIYKCHFLENISLHGEKQNEPTTDVINKRIPRIYDSALTSDTLIHKIVFYEFRCLVATLD